MKEYSRGITSPVVISSQVDRFIESADLSTFGMKTSLMSRRERSQQSGCFSR
jgi:hypothetical protein